MDRWTRQPVAIVVVLGLLFLGLLSCVTPQEGGPAEAPAAAAEETSAGEATGEQAAAEPGEGAPEAPAAEAPAHPSSAPEMPLSALPSEDRSFEMAAGVSFRSLGVLDLDEFTWALGSDRKLLIEIRKEVPETKAEAEMYLARLKQLAEQSDPVRLVPLANKLLDQSSIYFGWLETEFESEDERVREYYIGGAQGFRYALDEFRSAVLLLVINRLETAARLLAELEAEVLERAAEEE